MELELHKCKNHKNRKECISDGCWFYFQIDKCGVNYVNAKRSKISAFKKKMSKKMSKKSTKRYKNKRSKKKR